MKKAGKETLPCGDLKRGLGCQGGVFQTLGLIAKEKGEIFYLNLGLV